MEKKTTKKTAKPKTTKTKTTKKKTAELPILAPETTPFVANAPVENEPKVSFFGKIKKFLGL